MRRSSSASGGRACSPRAMAPGHQPGCRRPRDRPHQRHLRHPVRTATGRRRRIVEAFVATTSSSCRRRISAPARRSARPPGNSACRPLRSIPDGARAFSRVRHPGPLVCRLCSDGTGLIPTDARRRAGDGVLQGWRSAGGVLRSLPSAQAVLRPGDPRLHSSRPRSSRRRWPTSRTARSVADALDARSTRSKRTSNAIAATAH